MELGGHIWFGPAMRLRNCGLLQPRTQLHEITSLGDCVQTKQWHGLDAIMCIFRIVECACDDGLMLSPTMP